MNILGGLVLCLISFLFVGCSENIQSTQGGPKDQDLVELSRSQLQIQLGQLADELWLRTGELIFTDSHLPLTSANKDTLQKIREDLQQQIQAANEKIQAVNRRVAQRLQNKAKIKSLVIDLIDLDWNGEKQISLNSSNRLSMVKGESIRWNVEYEDKRTMTLNVIWSESGELFIEGQAVLTVTTWLEAIPFVTSIRWFNGGVRSQGLLNLTLRPSLI